jgi:outer membrane protein assembly factor BamB
MRLRGWPLRLSIAALVLVVLAGGAFAVMRSREPGDVSNPGVEFRADTPVPSPSPSPTPTPTSTSTAKPGRKANPADEFVWPLYGYTPDRRRYLPGPSLRPPYAKLWTVHAEALLEFSPVIADRMLFLVDDDGYAWGIWKRSGHVRWKRRLGVLAASSPAYGDGKLYITILSRAKGQPGRAVSLRARDGKILWSRPLPSRAESSPLLDDDRVYFGSEDGTVYALRASDGDVGWRFKAAGSVKGGLALSDGKLYFGDYAGKVYAIRQATGRLVWRTSTNGASFGLRAGQFYATPTVAWGRVYIGNTDSFMYSFGADRGKLAWRRDTGGYVYSSAAAANVPGGRPTVYVGSYDGLFYAFDARSGKTIWRYRDGGAISGGVTVVGDIVYFSNYRLRTTTGLGARTGRRVFRYPRGAFNPVVSDGERIYLTGHSSLYALRPEAKRAGSSRRR